jgi:lipopolysaccharide export system permease protein
MRIGRILDRYMASEFLLYFTFGSSLVVLFLMVNAILFEMLKFVIEKQVPFPIFMKILFYQLPSYAVVAFPMATLFATLISISRMSKDSEIDVMRTSGISVMRLLAPMLAMGILVSAISMGMIQKIVPWSNGRSAQLWRQFYMSDVMKQPVADQVFKGIGDKQFFIKEIDPAHGALRGIAIYDSSDGDFPTVTTAPAGSWNQKYITLRNGAIHHFKRNGIIDYEVEFSELKLNIERELEQIFGEQKSPQEMTFGELRNKITLFKKSGIDTKSWETDLQFKMSIPVASFICVLVGVPLSIRTGRSGMMMGIVACVTLILLYWVGTIVSTALGHQGVLPPAVAAWSLNAIFLVVGVALISRTRK